jgi:hypothetical protein
MDWFCPRCGTRNPMSREACVACTTERPAYVADAAHPDTEAGIDPQEAQRLRSQFRIAGTLTAILGVVWLAGSAGFTVMGLLDYNGLLEASTTRASQLQGLVTGVGVGLVLLVVGLASLIGGIGVARLKAWGRTAGIIAGIANMLSCGCLVGMGLGIWLLVLLFNPRASKLLGS